ncbi:hypothetical protein [Allorhizocola rhizosphaerae]|uniref:hypothetical protein n=1 Tax=Allorhizocola rhizosphaerae TaxID=1872709 RepID=UPI0013C2F9C0|nr:hypothetical protein [Allorhizocola rhizosphaerae]
MAGDAMSHTITSQSTKTKPAAARAMTQKPVGHAATPLERRCRLLLHAYPADYRAHRGDEIVATLLDSAGPHRTVPPLGDVLDVLGHALRRRMAAFDLHLGVPLAAPWALALAAGLSAFAWWRIEPVIPTTGPLAYAAWLSALAGWVLLRPGAARALIGVAIAATLATALLAVFVPPERPPVWVIMSLTGLGCIALAGYRPPTLESRFNVLAATVAVIVACGVVSPPAPGYYQPVLARIGAVVAAGVLATAVVALHRRRSGQSARLPIMARLLLALPATWLGPIDAIAWHLPLDDLTAARFGRLAHVVLATCLVLCVIGWFGQGGRARRAGGREEHSRAPFSKERLAGVGVGSAAGYAAFASFNAWPPHTIAAVCVLLLMAALVRARPCMPVAVLWACGTAVGCWAVGVYSNNWSTVGWDSPTKTVVLASMLTLVPSSVIGFAAVRPGARRLPGVVAGGWIAYLTLPALIAWGPLLWALAAMIVLQGLAEVRRAAHDRHADALIE